MQSLGSSTNQKIQLKSYFTCMTCHMNEGKLDSKNSKLTVYVACIKVAETWMIMMISNITSCYASKILSSFKLACLNALIIAKRMIWVIRLEDYLVEIYTSSYKTVL